jgi:hypothetical protein
MEEIMPQPKQMKYPDQHKTHETELDRTRQQQVLDAMAAALGEGITFKMTTTGTTYDAMMYYNDHPAGIIEIKFRNTPASMYPTYTIDAKKIDELAAIAKRDNVYAYLIVSWQGDIRGLDIPESVKRGTMYPSKLQKRRDRQELADLVYEIPMEDFKKIA